MDIHKNKAVALELLEDLSTGNVEGATNKFAEDFVWITPSDVRTFRHAGTRNKSEFVEILGRFRGFFTEEHRYKVVGTTCEGDRVAVEAEAGGMARGIPFFNRYHFLFQFRDGKIVVGKEYMDTAFAEWFNASVAGQTK
jgi:ketosteroid isomerase-like protein